VLDRGLRMPLSAEMLALAGTTLVYCTSDSNRKPLIDAGAEVVRVGERDGLVDIGDVLDDLGAREVNELLVEAGPVLAGSLLEGGFLDELVIYQAPHIMGSETLGMFRTPGWTELGDRRALEIVDVQKVGADTRITARLAD
jgi:diaminohydroxyphosphoribosylaminopyrimidine deaminase/5-amino-6-(5-phosphoribosylamino)uracil reductase